MNDTTMVTELTKTIQENSAKFVYFIFSITTVAIGYAMSSTQDMTPSLWLFLWGSSILAMTFSLWCGAVYVRENNKSIYHAVQAFNIDDVLARYKQDCDEEFKRKFINICAGNANAISLSDQFDVLLAQSIKNELDSSGLDVGYLTPAELRMRMADKVHNLLGYNDATGTFAASKHSGDKANRYMLWQIYSLIAGVFLFFVWHVIRIIELNQIAQPVVTWRLLAI